jgi:sRNA-binding carbon storage regulator CsrA
MLVLRRGKRQSVVIGDQITVTVEDFNDAGDGRRLFGATVGLGFEMPRYVSVYRDELRARRSSGPHSGKDAPPKQPRPGNLVEVSDAVVRLRIQVPRKVPVRHNGTPTVGHDMEEGADGPTTRASEPMANSPRVCPHESGCFGRLNDAIGLVLCQTLVCGLAVGWSPAFRLSFSG